MQSCYQKIIEAIGENCNREGLKDTPKRAAQAMEYLTKGYREELDVILNNALFTTDIQEMIIIKDIELYSLCEHHLLPFFGKCHIGYIPNGQVIGISKLARIVDMFSHRLQIQERLTDDIAKTVLAATSAKGVGVIIEARHMCMMMRGIEKQNSSLRTSILLGNFREDPKTRAEFLDLLNER